MTSGPETTMWKAFLETDFTSVAIPSQTQVLLFEQLFLVLGPLNMFVGPTTAAPEDGKCAKFGCRMMTCKCLQSFDEMDEEFYATPKDNTTEWFTGACATCNKRIKRASHAVRRPHSTGGWIGTYCCFACVENDKDALPMDAIEKNLVNIVSKQLMGIGLYDRKDDDANPYFDSASSDDED
jgi:hypothetical protein